MNTWWMDSIAAKGVRLLITTTQQQQQRYTSTNNTAAIASCRFITTTSSRSKLGQIQRHNIITATIVRPLYHDYYWRLAWNNNITTCQRRNLFTSNKNNNSNKENNGSTLVRWRESIYTNLFPKISSKEESIIKNNVVQNKTSKIKNNVRDRAFDIHSKLTTELESVKQRGTEAVQQQTQNVTNTAHTKMNQLFKSTMQQNRWHLWNPKQSSQTKKLNQSATNDTSHQRMQERVKQMSQTASQQIMSQTVVQTNNVVLHRIKAHIKSFITTNRIHSSMERFKSLFSFGWKSMIRYLWWWSLAAIFVYGIATTLPGHFVREYYNHHRIHEQQQQQQQQQQQKSAKESTNERMITAPTNDSKYYWFQRFIEKKPSSSPPPAVLDTTIGGSDGGGGGGGQRRREWWSFYSNSDKKTSDTSSTTLSSSSTSTSSWSWPSWNSKA